jgi:hypothetical protein
MVLIDAQIHLWSPDVSTRPWLPGSTQRAQGAACNAEQVLRVMDDAGVARTVLVPPSWVGDDNTDALDAARRWPDRFAGSTRRSARGGCCGGTDYTRLTVPYRDAVRHVREGMDFLGAADREWVAGRACAEWVGWKI